MSHCLSLASSNLFPTPSVCHNVTEEEKDDGDLQYLLHGASDFTKKKVKLNEYQLLERMLVFLKYKSRNMLRFVKDPLSLLLLMIKSGNYLVDVKWIIEGRGKGLDLARFSSLWALNLAPHEVTKRHLLNVFLPRNYYDGADADDPDCVIEEEEHPIPQASAPVHKYTPEEIRALFDESHDIPREQLVSAYDSNDDLEEPSGSRPSLPSKPTPRERMPPFSALYNDMEDVDMYEATHDIWGPSDSKSPPWPVEEPLYWEIDTKPSTTYEEPNFTLKCRTKVIEYAPWLLFNDPGMPRERPKARYFTRPTTLAQKIAIRKPLNVHALYFNTVLDDVRTKMVQTRLKEALYDLRHWDEELGHDDIFFFLEPGSIDREALRSLMVNRLEKTTSSLRAVVEGHGTQPFQDDEFRDQDPWVPIMKMPPR